MKSNSDKSRQSYEVVLVPAAVKTLRSKFPGRLTDAVVNFLYKELRFDPHEFGAYGRRLSGGCEKKFSAKQRRFRIVYKIDEGLGTITVIRVDPL